MLPVYCTFSMPSPRKFERSAYLQSHTTGELICAAEMQNAMNVDSLPRSRNGGGVVIAMVAKNRLGAR